MDHRGGQAGAVTTIFAVYILDHLLTPLMLEIDVDIRRLLAFFGDEPIEQKLVASRIDAGNLEAVTHRRIGRAPAPLTQDRWIARAGEINDILDGEEIARQIQLRNQRQFTLERLRNSPG